MTILMIEKSFLVSSRFIHYRRHVYHFVLVSMFLILIITFQTGNLAMESLLTITASRNASDVFKNELRSLGALDHIVNTGECLFLQLLLSSIYYLPDTNQG